LEIMKNLGLNIPVVGIAKKQETLIYKHEGNFKQLKLSQDSEGLKQIIKLRDEAHRFAQSYHHHLRLKKFKV